MLIRRGSQVGTRTLQEQQGTSVPSLERSDGRASGCRWATYQQVRELRQLLRAVAHRAIAHPKPRRETDRRAPRAIRTNGRGRATSLQTPTESVYAFLATAQLPAPPLCHPDHPQMRPTVLPITTENDIPAHFSPFPVARLPPRLPHRGHLPDNVTCTRAERRVDGLISAD